MNIVSRVQQTLALSCICAFLLTCTTAEAGETSKSKPIEHLLYQFQDGGEFGGFPAGGVVADKDGNLYGAASGGGPTNGGTVFKLTRSGTAFTFSVLYDFLSPPDAIHPLNVVLDSNGALYGASTYGGANNLGSVFKLTPNGSGYTESVLYSFKGGDSDGQNPYAGVIIDKKGVIYGTTGYNGSFGDCGVGTDCGTVFKLIPTKGGAYTEKVLHQFTGGDDGADPFGVLVLGTDGMLYGTTQGGGGGGGGGTVFRISTTGESYQIIYAFVEGLSGGEPTTGLAIGPGGVLYGTWFDFGGGVFSLTPDGLGKYTFQVLVAFDKWDGGSWIPSSSLVLDGTDLYGLTLYGGSDAGCGTGGCGSLFKLTGSGDSYSMSVRYAFAGGDNDGERPSGNLVLLRGQFYGATLSGGTNTIGTVFTVKK